MLKEVAFCARTGRRVAAMPSSENIAERRRSLLTRSRGRLCADHRPGVRRVLSWDCEALHCPPGWSAIKRMLHRWLQVYGMVGILSTTGPVARFELAADATATPL